MKKMICLLVAMMVMICITSVASATMSFEIKAFSNSTTNYQMSEYSEKKINDTNAAIYVTHRDDIDTEEYTNHFRGLEAASATSSSWTTRGTKWCTQGLKVPIQNSNIKSGKYYKVSARANTNYYDYDGVSSLWLYGTFNPNYPSED